MCEAGALPHDEVPGSPYADRRMNHRAFANLHAKSTEHEAAPTVQGSRAETEEYRPHDEPYRARDAIAERVSARAANRLFSGV